VIHLLIYLLKRAIENERQLRVAQEIQESLIQTEKLAVMGQLTASFAHEIGTPLNAVGGHVQLLKMNLEKQLDPPAIAPMVDRLGGFFDGGARGYGRPEVARRHGAHSYFEGSARGGFQQIKGK